MPILPDKLIPKRYVVREDKPILDRLHTATRIRHEIVKLNLKIGDCLHQPMIQEMLEEFVLAAFNVDFHEIDSDYPLFREERPRLSQPNSLRGACGFEKRGTVPGVGNLSLAG